MRYVLMMVFFISSALQADVVDDARSSMTAAKRETSTTGVATTDKDVASGANTSSGRVIEYGGVNRGVVEATPHILSADDLTAKRNKAPGNATSKNTKPEKAAKQNSVKLITGGDPSEGSAKVGRLPVLD